MFTFALFLTCLGWKRATMKVGKRAGNRAIFAIWRAYGEGPPPIWGAARAFSPHNFSHQKSRKKFTPRKHNFSHQKYRKKSPWSDWKKFRKKFVGKCFGGKESPQSCGKGARGC